MIESVMAFLFGACPPVHDKPRDAADATKAPKPIIEKKSLGQIISEEFDEKTAGEASPKSQAKNIGFEALSFTFGEKVWILPGDTTRSTECVGGIITGQVEDGPYAGFMIIRLPGPDGKTVMLPKKQLAKRNG